MVLLFMLGKKWEGIYGTEESLLAQIESELRGEFCMNAQQLEFIRLELTRALLDDSGVLKDS